MRVPLATLQRALSNETLQLILLPTEACNFRCTYCYEDFALPRMKDWVVRGVKNLIEARAPGLSMLQLSWFGGEPLLARDIVIEVMEHAQALARGHPNLQVVSDMTTNAWFLGRPLFERLVRLGVGKYQISFDGPRELHDQKRVQAGGRGTFDRVWDNVLALRDAPGEFEVIVRIHVDHENEESIPDFIAQCRAAFGDDPRFTLYLKALSRHGGPNDAELEILQGRERKTTIAALQRLADGERAKPPGHGAPQPVCYAATGNSLIVRADGRLSKCTVALAHPANVVGHLREDGSLEIEAPPMNAWMRGLWSGKKQELVCPMFDLAEPSAATPGAVASA